MATIDDVGDQLRSALSPREGVFDEKVAGAYSAHIAKIHEHAKEHYHDPDYPTLDIPIRELYFVLGNSIVGTNRVFNDINGMHLLQIIILLLYCCLLMLTLFSSLFAGRKVDDKYALVKKLALVTDGIELSDSEAYGVYWHRVPSSRPSAPPSGSINAERFLYVEARNLQLGEDVMLHCKDVMNKIAMEHNKAIYACFEIAVENTQARFTCKTSTSNDVDRDSLVGLMGRAHITRRRSKK